METANQVLVGSNDGELMYWLISLWLDRNSLLATWQRKMNAYGKHKLDLKFTFHLRVT